MVLSLWLTENSILLDIDQCYVLSAYVEKKQRLSMSTRISLVKKTTAKQIDKTFRSHSMFSDWHISCQWAPGQGHLWAVSKPTSLCQTFKPLQL